MKTFKYSSQNAKFQGLSVNLFLRTRLDVARVIKNKVEDKSEIIQTSLHFNVSM